MHELSATVTNDPAIGPKMDPDRTMLIVDDDETF